MAFCKGWADLQDLPIYPRHLKGHMHSWIYIDPDNAEYVLPDLDLYVLVRMRDEARQFKSEPIVQNKRLEYGTDGELCWSPGRLPLKWGAAWAWIEDPLSTVTPLKGQEYNTDSMN